MGGHTRLSIYTLQPHLHGFYTALIHPLNTAKGGKVKKPHAHKFKGVYKKLRDTRVNLATQGHLIDFL